VLEDSQTLGIGVYDKRKIAVAAYNEVGSGNNIAMIISTNDSFVDWGIDLYNSYREKARPVSELFSE
jgi:predicted transcriptional regulator